MIKMRNASKGERLARTLNASAGLRGSYAEICIAVDDEIDIHDLSMVNRTIYFNLRPQEDTFIARSHRDRILPLIGRAWKA